MQHLLRRRLAWALAVMVTVAIPSLLLLGKEDRITLQYYDQIQDGMTLAEVKAILGPDWSNSLLEPAMPLKGGVFWSAPGFQGLSGGASGCTSDTHFQMDRPPQYHHCDLF